MIDNLLCKLVYYYEKRQIRPYVYHLYANILLPIGHFLLIDLIIIIDLTQLYRVTRIIRLITIRMIRLIVNLDNFSLIINCLFL